MIASNPSPLRWSSALDSVAGWVSLLVGLPMAILMVGSPWLLDATFVGSSAWQEALQFFRHAASFAMAFVLVRSVSKETGQTQSLPIHLLMCFLRCMIAAFLVFSAMPLLQVAGLA
jgi:hypothetical protein